MFQEANLLTGRIVKCRLTTTQDEELAMKSLGSIQANQANMGAPKQIIQELIKMMIVEVDGKPVGYQELTPLDNFFSVKEIRQLELFYNYLHVPTEEEDDNFLKSIRPVSTVK